MNSTKIKIVALTIAFAVSGVVTRANSKPQTKEKNMSQANTEKIVEVVKQMSKSMEQGKLEAVMAAYESGATLVAQPGVPVSGPAFKEAMNGYVSMKPVFDMPKHEVIESGDIALHIAPWTMRAVDPTTGKEVVQKGLSLAVFRKQKNGSWLMVIDNPFGDNLLSSK